MGLTWCGGGALSTHDREAGALKGVTRDGGGRNMFETRCDMSRMVIERVGRYGRRGYSPVACAIGVSLVFYGDVSLARCFLQGVERGGSGAGGGEELVVELSEQVVVVAGRRRWLEGVAGVVVIVGSNSKREERGREGGSRGGRKGRGRGWEREKKNDSDEYQTITRSI
ncbi:hypothetical protein BJ165DRAFT_1411424 [Panaeolus papilionaceus]|nr:hypothetical protein BJ165DRAFT_1411424 [Panaeolus papilionaceus]